MSATSATPRPDARAAFRACVVAAIRDGEAMMAALAAEAGSVLEAQAPLAREPRRRDALEGARHLLAQHAPALVRGYPMALLEIFVGAGPDARAKPSEPAALDFGELSLMDEAEVIAQVELSRAQQTALHATEAVLAELDTLVSAAQGLPRVQPDRNPLRPENYIRALQQVVSATGVEPDVRALWMAPLRDALATQLKAAYRDAAARLRADGVEPVGYAVAASPGGRNRIREGPPGYGMPAPQGHGHGHLQGHGGVVPSTYSTTMGWDGAAPAWPLPAASQPPLGPEAEEALLTVAMLRQMLTQPLAALAAEPMAAGVSVPAALVPHPGALSALAGLPPGGIPLMAVPQSGALAAAAAEAMEDIAELERIVGRLSASVPAPLVAVGSTAFAAPPTGAAPAAARARSRTASEVVSRMMDNIAQDDRLLPPVQRSLQELRPALQRLVRHDPLFFTDDRHPARRLLDALTQRALSFDSEDADDFAEFARLMDRAVVRVNAGNTRSGDTFATALSELESAWSGQERHRREREEAASAVTLELARREALSRRVSADIRALARTEDDLPTDIVEFAAGPWSDVVACVQADRPGEDDPDGCLATVTELFWLARPEVAARSPEHLAPTATRVLGTLRAGLERIGHAPQMTAAVLERVSALHLAAAERASVLQSEGGGVLDSEAPDTGAALLASDEVPATPEENAAAHATAPSAAPAAGTELAIGTWVQLISNHRAVHTQLTWASPHHTLFLFTAPDGSTQSMTRRVRDKLMADGALTVLPGPPPGRAKGAGGKPGRPRG